MHYLTAYRWWRDGQLPVPARQMPSGAIIVDVAPERETRAVVYARVSSHDQRADLDRQVARVRDRLARFGVEYLESALAAQGRRIIVVDGAEQNVDLARDMIEVLTSFCARLYGKRGARNRALRAVTCAKNTEA